MARSVFCQYADRWELKRASHASLLLLRGERSLRTLFKDEARLLKIGAAAGGFASITLAAMIAVCVALFGVMASLSQDHVLHQSIAATVVHIATGLSGLVLIESMRRFAVTFGLNWPFGRESALILAVFGFVLSAWSIREMTDKLVVLSGSFKAISSDYVIDLKSDTAAYVQCAEEVWARRQRLEREWATATLQLRECRRQVELIKLLNSSNLSAGAQNVASRLAVGFSDQRKLCEFEKRLVRATASDLDDLIQSARSKHFCKRPHERIPGH